MSASPKPAPKYRHYKPKDLGVVRIDGRDHYLGKYGTPESYEKYHRLLAERYAHGPATPLGARKLGAAEPLTMTEVCVRYYRHCEQYYVKNGEATNQVRMIRLSLKVLRSLYGSTLAKDFGPLALEACQAEFVRQGLSRREVNRRVSLIKQAIRWATSKELLPRDAYHGLLSVGGLKRGVARLRPRRSDPCQRRSWNARSSTLPHRGGHGPSSARHRNAARRAGHHEGMRPEHVRPGLGIPARSTRASITRP